MADTRWSLTVQLGETPGRKITTESISFENREQALSQLVQLGEFGRPLPDRIYVLENELGEQICFVGANYISHSLRQFVNVEPEEYPF